MIALDTNILVRLIMEDEPNQAASAKQLVLANTCYITASVVQEVVWVLQKTYKIKREDIADVVEKITETQQFVLDDEAAMSRSVLWFRQGLDFADALHLAYSHHCESFVTFDKAFIKVAVSLSSAIPVIQP